MAETAPRVDPVNEDQSRGFEEGISINLSNHNLDVISADLFDESSRPRPLVDLNVSNNALTELPSALGSISELEVLDCAFNSLKALPEVIGYLQNLKLLNCGGNSLSSLPAMLPNTLTELLLSHNRLKVVPQGVLAPLAALRVLYLNHNLMDVLPADIVHLKNLEELAVSSNLLTIIPDFVFGLTNLRQLHCDNNSISELSPQISGLQKLEVLNLNDNELTTLPTEVEYLSKLRMLSLMHNQLTMLPTEIGTRSVGAMVILIGGNAMCHTFQLGGSNGPIFTASDIGDRPIIINGSKNRPPPSPMSPVASHGTEAMQSFLQQQPSPSLAGRALVDFQPTGGRRGPASQQAATRMELGLDPPPSPVRIGGPPPGFGGLPRSGSTGLGPSTPPPGYTTKSPGGGRRGYDGMGNGGPPGVGRGYRARSPGQGRYGRFFSTDDDRRGFVRSPSYPNRIMNDMTGSPRAGGPRTPYTSRTGYGRRTPSAKHRLTRVGSSSDIGADAEELALRKARGLLNKLTVEKFGSLSNALLSISFTSLSILKSVIDLIFLKAISEPTFAGMYSDLCAKLSEHSPEFPQGEGPPQTFRRLLIAKLQRDFQGWIDVKDTVPTPIAQQELASTPDSPEDGQEANMDEAAPKEMGKESRVQMIGNMIFIGELFKHGILTANIMHFCVGKLLGRVQQGSQACADGVIKLLTIIGGDLEKPDGQHMDTYMKVLAQLVAPQAGYTFDSRILYSCRELADLRSNEWVPRREKEGPKTIGEIHAVAARNRGWAKDGREGPNRAGRGRGAWSPAASPRSPRGGRGGGAGWRLPHPHASTSPKSPRHKGNRPCGAPSPVHPPHASMPPAGPPLDAQPMPAAQSAEIDSVPSHSSKDASVRGGPRSEAQPAPVALEPGPPGQGGFECSDSTYTRQSALLIDEYLSAKDLPAAVECALQLTHDHDAQKQGGSESTCGCDCRAALVVTLLNTAMDRGDQAVSAVSDLLFELVKQNALPPLHAQFGLCALIEMLPDLALDVTSAPTVVGRVCARAMTLSADRDRNPLQPEAAAASIRAMIGLTKGWVGVNEGLSPGSSAGRTALQFAVGLIRDMIKLVGPDTARSALSSPACASPAPGAAAASSWYHSQHGWAVDVLGDACRSDGQLKTDAEIETSLAALRKEHDLDFLFSLQSESESETNVAPAPPLASTTPLQPLPEAEQTGPATPTDPTPPSPTLAPGSPPEHVPIPAPLLVGRAMTNPSNTTAETETNATGPRPVSAPQRSTMVPVLDPSASTFAPGCSSPPSGTGSDPVSSEAGPEPVDGLSPDAPEFLPPALSLDSAPLTEAIPSTSPAVGQAVAGSANDPAMFVSVTEPDR